MKQSTPMIPICYYFELQRLHNIIMRIQEPRRV